MFDPNTPGVPERRVPELQDNHQAQPWFVSDEKTKSSANQKTKTFVKRTMSVLLPLLGIGTIITMLGLALYYVIGLYQ